MVLQETHDELGKPVAFSNIMQKLCENTIHLPDTPYQLWLAFDK